jgi:N-acetylmuramoyl-L-alanine amidase
MGAIYLHWLPDVLRDAGCQVAVERGWEWRSRGSGGFDMNPLAVSWHHTASSASLSNQVYQMCYQSAAKPIANLAIGVDGTVVVMAAGATNTSGKGMSMRFSRGWVNTDNANRQTVGIECCNNGVGQTWPVAQIDATFCAVLAINKALGNQPDDCYTHHRYAPTRKIDPATAAAVQGSWKPESVNTSGSWKNDDVLAELRKRSTPIVVPPPTNPVPGIDPKDYEVHRLEASMRVLDTRTTGSGQDPVTTFDVTKPIPANKNLKFKPHSKYGLPAGITAYLAHVTFINPPGNGFFQAWANGASTMGTGDNGNFAGGAVTDCFSMIPAGDSIFNFKINRSCDITVDLVGYLT